MPTTSDTAAPRRVAVRAIPRLTRPRIVLVAACVVSRSWLSRAVMLKPGDPAPPFRLPSTEGRDLSLQDFRGKRVVLYFYPKDETPGCTAEACDFRDNLARVKSTGAEVLGVSKDSIASH